MAEGKLSEEEIYECLKSLNVPVRMNDLKVPSREIMVRVFECFVKDLQIDIAGYELRTWEATNHLEESDIYEEPMYLILLAMTVNYITNRYGLDITVKDIVEPKPKRTKKILNYLLVFWKYYVLKCARFRAIEDTYEEDKRKAESLIIENQSLDEKYNEMLTVLKDTQPSKEELSDIVAVKSEKTTKLQKESDAVATDYQALKTKEVNLRNAISAIDVQILTEKQTLEELGQLILSSPERMNSEIQKLQDRIRLEDLKVKELENKHKDIEKKLQLLEECKQDEEKDLKILNDLSEAYNHIRETVKGIVSVHQEIDEEEDKIKRLQMDVDHKEEFIDQQKQKSAKIGLNSKKQIETLKEVLKMNVNEEGHEVSSIEFIKTAINDMQEFIDTETNSILEITAKCKEANVKNKGRKAQFESKMKEVGTNFKSDCDDIVETIKRTFPYDLEKI